MDFLAFLSYTVLTAFTPGPNNLLALTHANRDGFKRTLPFLLGVLAGFTIVMGACAACSSLLFAWIPAIKPYMQVVGAAYILFLAWTVLRDRPHEGKSGAVAGNSFLSGMMLQFVNVKIILYGVTAMSSYVLPYHQNAVDILQYTLLLTLIGLSGTTCWALFGAVFERVLQRYRKPINVMMALLLVYCAVSLFI